MTHILEQIGLTQNESTVYLTVQKHGGKTAAWIAREAKLDKSSCYRAVESLVDKGLLLPSPKKRGTTYSSASPKVLQDLITEKEHALIKEKTDLDLFIKSLIKNTDERVTSIHIEKGIEAVKKSMNTMLESAIRCKTPIKERYRLDDPYFKDPIYAKWLRDVFIKKRIKAGVLTKCIVDFAKNHDWDSIVRSDSKLLKEVHLMPTSVKDPNNLRVAGDFVTIVSFDKNKDYIVITITDKYVAALIDNMFDFMWEHTKPYTG